MESWTALWAAAPALATLLTLWVKLNKLRRDHDAQLERLVAWRTRKDEADKRHDNELNRLRASLREQESKERENNLRIFEKLDGLAKDVAWVKAHIQNGFRR